MIFLKEIIIRQLEDIAEDGYKKFSSSLVPGTKERMLGVRIPELRKMAAKISRGDWREFLDTGADDCFEITMLRGMVIGCAKMSFPERCAYTSDFLKEIDNWSVCDSFCAGYSVEKEEREDAFLFISKYFSDSREYYARFAVVMALDHFIDKEYIDRVLPMLEKVKNKGYYAKMAVGWAISVCFVKFRDKTLEAMQSGEFSDEIITTAVKKIRESKRVSNEDKAAAAALLKGKHHK